MPDLGARRRTLRTVIVILAVLDLAAIVYLLSPLSQSRAQRQAERDRVQQQLQVREREAAPLKNLDQKLAVARGEISDFYEHRFAGEYSAIAEEVGKVARENNVRISLAKYGAEEAESPGLQRVKIEAGIDGDYVNIVKFINALERDKLFFIIDSVALTEQQGGTVKLVVQLEAYLKTA
ncbi:MAG TPA: GspMb/PilO family protein [Terriglobales bacterium]|nr:GspMb/PilO family protein [Terriglobales bacterium]